MLDRFPTSAAPGCGCLMNAKECTLPGEAIKTAVPHEGTADFGISLELSDSH
jgi:hypothetical protein